MKAFNLHNPTYLELDDAYRSLPKLGSVLIESSNHEKALVDLEKIGFVAIEIMSNAPDNDYQTIRAFKGKHGPCNFTGKKVAYTGAALAVLDDDNHILVSSEFEDVCDKTFKVLGLPPYAGLILGKETHHSDNSKNDDESGDFESALLSLLDRLGKIPQDPGQRTTLFYPGPFRMLFLKDGTIVYRGMWCRVPIELSGKLIQHDRCMQSKDEKKGLLTFFQEKYSNEGSSSLLHTFKPKVTSEQEYESDFSKLKNISKKLKNRLLHLIDNHKKYFILIGNEAGDRTGCCPSEEVTEANMFVRNGILSSLAEPVQGDSCPVTMYAFKEELSAGSDGFNSKINEDFRGSVRSFLSKSPQPVTIQILKWILIGFIIISLGFAARKCQNLGSVSSEETLYEQLNPSLNDRFMVILFHNQKRCFQCLQMEKYATDLIKNDFSDEPGMDDVVFRTIVIDDPDNASLVNMFGIFAPTLVLIEFDEKELSRSKVLFDITGLYRDEEVFTDQLNREINQFLITTNE